MTVSTTIYYVNVAGNGATTVFTFPFIADNSSTIKVTYTDTNGVKTVLNPSVYTLFLNAPAVGTLWGIGGTVTYPLSGSPIASGTTLTIERIVPYTQNISISNQGAFYPQAVEQALDVLELQIQQIEGNASSVRNVHAPIVDGEIDMVLPPIAGRKQSFLYFDINGLPTSVVGIPSTTPIGPGSKLFFLSNYLTLALADSAASAASGVLIIDTNITLTGNTTLNSKTVQFVGGVITLGTFTLTIANDISASIDTQIFNINSSGNVSLTRGGTIVYVGWFGALGNGSNDDTIPIQAAVVTAQSCLGTVFLPTSKISTNGYKVTAPIVISKPIKFLGQHYANTFIYGFGLTNVQYVIDVDGLIAPNLEGVEIGGITPFTNNNSPALIRIRDTSNSYFHDIGIRNCLHGLFITGTRCFSNTYERIIATGGGPVTSSTVIFSAFTGGGQHTFLGCSFGGAIGFSVSVNSTVDGSLSLLSCNFESCSSNSLYIGGNVRGLSIIGCRSENCAGPDEDFFINPDPAKVVAGLVISGCWFDHNLASYAIQLGGAGGIVRGFNISGNYALNYPTGFIRLNGDGQSGSITGNYLDTMSVVVNTVRPGVLVMNNETSAAALTPTWNPPLSTPDYTVTNPSTSRSLDVTGATLGQLSAVVGTMITDLITVGLYK